MSTTISAPDALPSRTVRHHDPGGERPTVVVGVDDRPATLRAAVWAAREAACRGLELTLVAAAKSPRAREESHVDLARARRIVEQTVAVPVTERVLPGPVTAALETATREAELLVLGARTPDGYGDVTVGPLTEHLLTRAACPVVVVPAAWEVDRRHEGEVVAAADPADPRGAAAGPVALAVDVAARWRAPLLAAAVVRREREHVEVAQGRRMLDEVLRGLRARHRAEDVVCRGEPAAALLDLVGPATGLLVLGARGARTSPSSALGPTCQAVVRWARCPVAVVPPGVPGVRSTAVSPEVAGVTW